MALNLKWLGSKIENALSEPGIPGALSWGRCASTFGFVCSAVWISVHLYMKHAFPDPDHIKSLTEYSLGPYGANKGATMIGKFADRIGNSSKDNQ